MFTLDVKYVALTVGVLGVAVWGVVGSGWHYARAAGGATIVHQRDDAFAPVKKPVAPVEMPVAIASETTPVAPELAASTPEAAPIELAATPADVAVAPLEAAPAATDAAEASAAVTILDDVYYDANREALVVPYSGAAPQASRIYKERDGLAFVDFTGARTAFGRPRFKRQADAAFKSYILNTRPGQDRARLSFVVARPGELQVEAAAGELVVRLTRP